MKVLLINGSTRKDGCTYLALAEAAKTLQEEGVQTEIVQLGAGAVRDCIGCNGCQGKGRCVFQDDTVNEWLLNCIQAGKQQGIEPPTAETTHWTNFNR